jgi:thiamine-phosphate pyrophosphorylase
VPPDFPRLCAIVDSEYATRLGWQAVDLARAYLEGGARFLQVRGKDQSGAALLDLASSVVSLARDRHAIVIVNDRADIAKLAGADGVHLGQEDLPPARARTILGPSAIIGRSTHTVGQIESAAREPVSYLAIGPVFQTRTKATGYDAVGLSLVRAAVRSGVPVVAIGGITLDTAPDVIAAGASSVAVIGDLLATRDPSGRVREYMGRLERI